MARGEDGLAAEASPVVALAAAFPGGPSASGPFPDAPSAGTTSAAGACFARSLSRKEREPWNTFGLGVISALNLQRVTTRSTRSGSLCCWSVWGVFCKPLLGTKTCILVGEWRDNFPPQERQLLTACLRTAPQFWQIINSTIYSPAASCFDSFLLAKLSA